MPKPKKGETKKEYIPRCISYLHDEGKYDKHDQIVAICYSMWRRKDEMEVLDKIDILIDEQGTVQADIAPDQMSKAVSGRPRRDGSGPYGTGRKKKRKKEKNPDSCPYDKNPK